MSGDLIAKIAAGIKRGYAIEDRRFWNDPCIRLHAALIGCAEAQIRECGRIFGNPDIRAGKSDRRQFGDGMTLAWFQRHFPDVQLTEEQMACCRYLEQRGKRFCIDFGYENAPGMVWAEIDAEIDEREQSRRSERWLD